MLAPGSTVANGPTVTKYEIRVVVSFLGSGVDAPDSVGVVLAGLDGAGEWDELGGAPITAFSQIIQPSSTTMGPSYA